MFGMSDGLMTRLQSVRNAAVCLGPDLQKILLNTIMLQ